MLLLSFNAWADHPTVGLGPGLSGPMVTIPGVTLPEKALSFDLRTEVINFDDFPDAELIEFAENDQEVHSTDWLISTSIGLAYGFTDDLTFGLRLPYIYRNDIREGPHHDEHDEHGEGVEVLGDAEGIGDLTLFGQYRFLHRPQAGLHLSLLFGMKAPTGDTDEKTAEGERFEVEHQPGSGSWDPMLGIAFTWHRDGIAFHGNLLYTLATEGSQDTDLGDSFTYNAALSWRMPEREHSHRGIEQHSHLAWDLILELNGEYRDKEEVDGDKDPHTGGNFLYLSPGVRLTGESGMSASLSLGLPLYEDLNGDQSEPDLRSLVSVGVAF